MKARWTPWTTAEVAVAMDRSLTVAQAAARLGRTPTAVAAKRHSVRHAADNKSQSGVPPKRIDDPRGKILAFIRDTVRERGYPPSIREIGEAIGLTSTSSVAYHLQILKQEGLIERAPGRPRAVVVRATPDVLLAELVNARDELDEGSTVIARAILSALIDELCGTPMLAEHEIPALGAKLDRHLHAIADEIYPTNGTAPGASGAAYDAPMKGDAS